MLKYNGYLIEAAPEKLAVSGEWVAKVNIWRDTDNIVSIKPFYSTGQTFKTEAEAIEYSNSLGAQLIDGNDPNLP